MVGATNEKQIHHSSFNYWRNLSPLSRNPIMNTSKNVYGQTIISFSSRVADVLEMTCTRRPPDDVCRGWLYGVDDDRLQSWVLEHLKHSLQWSQGIGMIEAAIYAADQHEEDSHIDKVESKYESFEQGIQAYLLNNSLVVNPQ